MKKRNCNLSFVIEGFCKHLYINHIGVFAMTITNDSIKKGKENGVFMELFSAF